ncbi:N-acetylglucosamine-6-phosphate deacetylase [Vibrio hangzhouensis]|uniref:N-acetylglucosamine 6-phosphate deacetylase n=1 Tax=Vibrio hangzhouensis TaxID=462991 RepID=A0A1H6B7X9_9VIBR|nr:N-acetylglucosamine-6-phosphate deacetylase [Vibrio hangzhouensis]SEG56949.1 N-acetylglucosamine 6-phosphate deacetylase [Vibrio hangzhouensis]
MLFAVKCARTFTHSGIETDSYVVVEDGTIQAITKREPKGMQVHTFPNLSLLPGFIDIHIHGRHGSDVMDATSESLQTISNALPATGVVAWVGTTVTAPMPEILRALENVKAYLPQQDRCGAQLLGSFLEGPYFTETNRGSHPTSFLKPANIEELELLLAAADKSLLRVALAPETEGAMDCIEWLKARNILVSIAHTDANYDQVTEAFHKGADCGVHLFNGMSGLHHREPGCAGAVLFHDMLAELIADGIHVNPVMMQLAYRMKSYRGIALITDCMRAGGLDDGDYQLGAQMVQVRDGQARTKCGSLAGSTCSLNQAVRNMIFKAGVPEWEAVQMASAVPASYLGIEDRLGAVAVGMDASFTLVDSDLNVHRTIIDGEWVYQS